MMHLSPTSRLIWLFYPAMAAISIVEDEFEKQFYRQYCNAVNVVVVVIRWNRHY